MRIALVGTRGVPARYGGFETCVEEVGRRLVELGHEVVVYCRKEPGTPAGPARYEGMRLVHLSALRFKSIETLSHSGLSVAHLLRHPVDAAVVFNSANSIYLPFLKARGIKVATHVDGLEWQRAKWGKFGRRYYRSAEALGVRWSDALIADAHGIADYYHERFGAATTQISYGTSIQLAAESDRVREIGLRPDEYHLVVARFEPENNVHKIVKGYCQSSATLPLVVVGSAPYADAYTRLVHGAADSRVQFLGGVWDQRLLDQLYANARTYLHGHSVGGTNPSLLRATGAATATIAFDVSFNRDVAQDSGRYFRTAGDVAHEVESAESDPRATHARGMSGQTYARAYDWDDVARSYERLLQRLVPTATSSTALLAEKELLR